MYHHAARVRDKRLAFQTWSEGARLFHTVALAAPGLVALCVMPDHVHVLCPGDVRARLGVALGGFARWRNLRRCESGPVWEPVAEPEWVDGPLKIQRNIRYIHLNPCRAGMVSDPMAWPLSTHIDALGLCLGAVRRAAGDPDRLHAYISSDPSVSVSGTDLPFAGGGVPSPSDVLDATSMATRTPLRALRQRGPGRRLAIRSMRALTPASHAEIGALVGVSRVTVARTRCGVDPAVRIIERWVGDSRCTPLDNSILRDILRRSPYRNHRR